MAKTSVPGFTCPRCGESAFVTHTGRANGGEFITRRRRCLECKIIFITVEAPLPPEAKQNLHTYDEDLRTYHRESYRRRVGYQHKITRPLAPIKQIKVKVSTT